MESKRGRKWGYVVLSIGVAVARAQSADLDAFHEAALDTLGGALVEGLAIEGSGWDACLGQAWSINEGWARWELSDYRRQFDYENGRSRHSTLRRAEMDPGKAGGCGAQPGASPREEEGFIGSDATWADQLLVWMTPHGVLSLLEEENAGLQQSGEGWQLTLQPVRDAVEYTMIADYNAEYELQRITTWLDDAIFGDMEVVAEFDDYRDFNGIPYPAAMTISQGGYTTLSLDISGVASYGEPISGSARNFPPPASDEDTPAFEEIAPGVFAFYGPYQSVAVEFSDFSVVIDGLQSDSRVAELIQQVKQAIPDKPIGYVVSTHSHFDHASGLRQFAAEGAVILMHEMNVAFFEKALSTPRTLRTDPTEPAEVQVEIEGIEGRHVIGDEAGQVLELYTLGPSAHAADMVVAYLPAIKTIVEADVYQPWINPFFSGDGEGPHPYLAYLARELEQAGIDYENFVPIHVPPEPPIMSRKELDEAVAP